MTQFKPTALVLWGDGAPEAHHTAKLLQNLGLFKNELQYLHKWVFWMRDGLKCIPWESHQLRVWVGQLPDHFGWGCLQAKGAGLHAIRRPEPFGKFKCFRLFLLIQAKEYTKKWGKINSFLSEYRQLLTKWVPLAINFQNYSLAQIRAAFHEEVMKPG